MIRVLFLVPYPLGEAPSQRFRFEQYLDALTERAIECETQSFLTADNWRVFYERSATGAKVRALVGGFARRLAILPRAASFDFVFIHREAAPLGPPFFEFVLSKVLRRRIIYDFDDAIWMTDKVGEGLFEKAVRWRGKVKWICRWSHAVSCGNEYLKQFAAQWTRHAVYVPTTIDTARGHVLSLKQARRTDRLVIGWTGSHSTLKYLKGIEPALQRIEATYPTAEFHVIADRPPDLALRRLVFKPWSKDTEVSDLAEFDIGIMPLPNDEWSKGKCGFKALQYMAMEVPTVVSPVGVNTAIVEHGVNGLIARDDEWVSMLSMLLDDAGLRSRLGSAGRVTVEQRYSVKATTKAFAALFSVAQA